MTNLHDLNKDDINRHTNVEGDKFDRLQPCTKNYRQMKNDENKKNCLPEERPQQIVIQYQMVRSENIHINHIIQTEQVVFVHLGIYTHACI